MPDEPSPAEISKAPSDQANSQEQILLRTDQVISATQSAEIEVNTKSESPETAEELDFIYKIGSGSTKVDINQLSRVLVSLSAIISESARIMDVQGDENLAISVRPFDRGSFIVDIALRLHAVSGTVGTLFSSSSELITQVLQSVGLVKKAGEELISVLDLVRKLRGTKPHRIKAQNDRSFVYQSSDETAINVSAPVHHLYNSSVVINNFYGLSEPASRADVSSVDTYLKGQEDATKVSLGKEDVKALQSSQQAKPVLSQQEPIENVSVKYLRPKSGTYGESTGSWTFSVSGTNQKLRATISDNNFLQRFSRGEVRFFKQDTLKVRIREAQHIEGDSVRTENDILEVLEYISGASTG